MSDLKDHDPNEGEWIAFNLMTGSIGIEPSPHLPARYRVGYKPVELAPPPEFIDLSWLDDNPNLVRGYN